MKNRNQEQRAEHRERIPLGTFKSKLEVREKIDGYELRWINDKGDRLRQAQAGGYQYVQQDEVPGVASTSTDSRVCKVVSEGRESMNGYLMKIKSEYYLEDQLAKESKNQEVDDALRQGKPGGNVVDNQYVPKGHTQQI